MAPLSHDFFCIISMPGLAAVDREGPFLGARNKWKSIIFEQNNNFVRFVSDIHQE
jgi:hypothetical protein